MLERDQKVIGVKLEIDTYGQWGTVYDVLPDKSLKVVSLFDKGYQEIADGRIPEMQDIAITRSRELGVAYIRNNHNLIAQIRHARAVKLR